MTLRTGKYGRYRYYTCSTCARQGKAACKGRSIPMDTLDDLVLDQLTARVFQPERLAELLKELLDRTESGQQKLRSELKDLRKALRATDTRLSRLYEAIETERSEERRGGKECVRRCRSRWSP